jgi:DNA-binding PadR family transcriptional regulator
MESPSNLANKLEKRVIQDFMDIYILEEMEKSSLSGYDIIVLMQKRFRLMVSSGTVYSLLYSMERDGWIKGVWDERKRVYELTEKAQHEARIIAKVNEGVRNFLRSISLLNATARS